MVTGLLLLLLGGWVLWKLPANGLHRADLLVAWGLKLLACALFLWIYSVYYGVGTLTADPAAFMRESALLSKVANHSVGDYLQFLFGGEDQAMINRYLPATTHWNTGDLTLLNDSKNVIRFNSLIYFISGGKVFVHCMVFSFFSLLGFREVYLALAHRIQLPKRLFWYVLIGMPSLVFWTGSMLKEPFMMVGFCLLLRAWLGELSFGARLWRWLAGVLLLLAFKPYVLLCLLPALLLWVVARKLLRDRLLMTGAAMLLLSGVAVFLLPKQTDKAVFLLTRKQFDFINVGKGGLHAYADTCFYFFRPDQFRYLRIDEQRLEVYLRQPIQAKKVAAGKALPFEDVWLKPNKKAWYLYFKSAGCSSYVPITPIDDSGRQLLKNIPEAFANAAFRPFFGDPGGNLKYFAIVETIALFLLAFLPFLRWRQVDRRTRTDAVALLLFATLLFLLIGWITPVLGAIVRYRIPAYLAILLAAVLVYKPKKKEKSWEKSPS